MGFIRFDPERCDLCGACIKSCPFGALFMSNKGIQADEKCRMCRGCVRGCARQAISFEQKAKAFDKQKWKDSPIFVEQERGGIHTVAYELIGEAKRLAEKVNYQVTGKLCSGRWRRRGKSGRSIIALRREQSICIRTPGVYLV